MIKIFLIVALFTISCSDKIAVAPEPSKAIDSFFVFETTGVLPGQNYGYNWWDFILPIINDSSVINVFVRSDTCVWLVPDWYAMRDWQVVRIYMDSSAEIGDEFKIAIKNSTHP